MLGRMGVLTETVTWGNGRGEVGRQIVTNGDRGREGVKIPVFSLRNCCEASTIRLQQLLCGYYLVNYKKIN